MFIGAGPADPKVPGFRGGYELHLPVLDAGMAPRAAEKLGRTGETITVRAANLRWDRALLPGTYGLMRASVADSSPMWHRILTVQPGKGKLPPAPVVDALRGLDAAVRSYVDAHADAIARGNTVPKLASAADTRMGYMLLNRNPVPVPLDPAQDEAVYVRLDPNDPASRELQRAGAVLAEAIALHAEVQGRDSAVRPEIPALY